MDRSAGWFDFAAGLTGLEIASYPEAPLTTILVFGGVKPTEIVSYSMWARRFQARHNDH